MALTNLQCKNAKPKEKSYKLAAGRGLYLEVMPNGAKYWRMKYRYLGKEKRLAFGVYDEVSLKEAEEKCTEARKLLDQNIDPSVHKKEATRVAKLKAGNTFELVARQWHETFKEKWTERHADTVIRRIEIDMFPALGALPITDIKPSQIIEVLKRVQSRKAYEPAHRLKQYCTQIFRYAIAHELCEQNPAAEVGMVLKPVKKKHYASITIEELPELLRAIDKNDACLHLETRHAIRLLMLTFVRTKELIEAKWDEFDLENAQWVIPASRMKMKTEHIVPLSRQSLEILRNLKEIHGHREWIFPGQYSPKKHMSNNTILKGLGRLGFKGRMTGHGFRSLAMTTLMEKLGYPYEIPDTQLSHAKGNMTRRAYDRTKYLDQRKKMMQEWADYIDEIAKTGKIIPVDFPRKSA